MLKFKQYLTMAKVWLSKLTGNKPKVQIAIGIFVIFLFLAMATTCRSAEAASYMQAELGSTIIRGETPSLMLTAVYPDLGPGDADLQCGVGLIGESGDYGNNALMQCLIVDGLGKFDFGLGVAGLIKTDGYNGSNANFSLMFGYRLTNRFGLIYRHYSNAGAVHPNLGRDILLIQYRF